MKTVLILEDLPNSLIWLSAIVESAFPIAAVYKAETVQAALALCDEQVFDLGLIDLHLPDGSGITVIERLSAQEPRAHSVVATIYDDDAHIFPALQAGAEGYLLKERAKEELVDALKGIVSGCPPLSASIARRLLDHFHHTGGAPKRALTERETEILALVGKGFSRKEIAGLLSISAHTTHQHIKSIYRKLNVASRAEAAIEAARRGLV